MFRRVATLTDHTCQAGGSAVLAVLAILATLAILAILAILTVLAALAVPGERPRAARESNSPSKAAHDG